jgi:hypothetical protein
MKQKKHTDKRKNINNIGRNKQTASSAAYKQIKQVTKDYQKSNSDNQTDNKDSNRNRDMSMGLGDDKKLKPKTVDQKEEKLHSSPSEAVTTPSSSPLRATPTLQPEEVLDSYRYNAMSDMKEAAYMKPDNTSKLFSHVEEKQRLDPSTISINDNVKKTDLENSLSTNPDTTSFRAMVNPALEERERNAMESKEDDVVSKQDVEPDNTQVHKESEKQDHLGESVRFYDNENKESQSNSLKNDDYNPFIFGIKLWQSYNVTWINAYNDFMKAWMGMIKS